MSDPNDDYYLGLYWSARKESAAECGVHIAKFLRALAKTHPAFESWYQTANYDEKSKEPQIPISAKGVTAILETIARRDESKGKRDAEMGYMLFFGNLGQRNITVNGNFQCGGYSVWLRNVTLLEFWSGEGATKSLVTFDMMSRLLKIGVECWEPDKAIVTSHAFRDSVRRDYKEHFVGWMTYVSKKFGELPPVPEPAFVERIRNHGNIIVLSHEPPSAYDPKAIELARKVYEQCNIAAVKLTAH